MISFFNRLKIAIFAESGIYKTRQCFTLEIRLKIAIFAESGILLGDAGVPDDHRLKIAIFAESGIVKKKKKKKMSKTASKLRFSQRVE